MTKVFSVIYFAALLLPYQAAFGIFESTEQPQKEKPFTAPFVLMPHPPTIPKADLNACPFEGCQYGKWTVRNRVRVYSTWKSGRKQIAILRKREQITALTGVNVVLRPGKGVFSRDVPIYGAKLGDVAYTYMYCGEGAVDIWTNGRFIKCAEPNFSGQHDLSCGLDCDGRYLDLGKHEWWAKIRLSDGRIGWVLVAGNFDGIDALE